jgi:CRP-like cAMP-binding protein
MEIMIQDNFTESQTPYLPSVKQTSVMIEFQHFAMALSQFAGISEQEIQHAQPFWNIKNFTKGEFYNVQHTICRHLGFITNGVFRSYITDDNGEEKNIFFFSANQFVVTFKSFINQVPCDYHTRAMADATVVCITLDNLLKLYKTSHAWEHFGRLLAQEAFNVAIDRAESFLFKTPEERYIELLSKHPGLIQEIPLYHISSYLGIQGPSLSRIRKRISRR